MASAARPWAASDMPRTLRQLWADEDDADEGAADEASKEEAPDEPDADNRELAAKRRASRLRAKQNGRARRSVVIHGKAQ